MGQQNGKQAKKIKNVHPRESFVQNHDVEDPKSGHHNRASSSARKSSLVRISQRNSSVRNSKQHERKKADKLPLTESEKRKDEDFTDIQLRIDTENDEVLHEHWRLNLRRICTIWSRMFRLPFIHEPLNYVNVSEYQTKSDKYFNELYKPAEIPLSPKSSLILEMDLNFKEDCIGLYDDIANARIGGTESELFDTGKLNMKEFEGWGSEDFQILKRTFQLFDKNKDGTVDFYEWSEVIEEFGDTTQEDERKFYYDMADPDGLGTIDFQQFCSLMYNLTMRPVGNSSTDNPVFQSSDSLPISGSDSLIRKVRFSPGPQKKGSKDGNIILKGGSVSTIASLDADEDINEQKLKLLPLGETLRRIKKNIQRISAMDVIQQLQAGVF